METRLYSHVERKEPEVVGNINSCWKLEGLRPSAGAPTVLREILPLIWACNLRFEPLSAKGGRSTGAFPHIVG